MQAKMARELANQFNEEAFDKLELGLKIRETALKGGNFLFIKEEILITNNIPKDAFAEYLDRSLDYQVYNHNYGIKINW